ncbi:O-antigen ligase family protein [Sphingobium aquiterrae]|uniref:O-antigen ligase family protein n=1 Tax=Sphingobium aquiterrae TaxID=2038656 RepID=UPI003019BC36
MGGTAGTGSFAWSGISTRRKILIAALAAIFALSMLGPAMTYTGALGTGDGTQGRQIGFAAIFALIVVALRPIAFPRRLLVVPASILVALGWYWASVVWAINPEIALRRIVLTTIIIWSIFALVRNLGYTVSLNTVRVVMLLLLAANYGAVFFFPDVGMHPKSVSPGDGEILTRLWRGVMTHKNFAGAACAYTVLLFAFDRRKIPLWLSGAVVMAAGWFLIESGSKTSAGLCLFAVAIGAVFSLWPGKGRPAAIVFLLIVGMAGAIAGLVFKDPLNASFTDAKAFTGRPLIWKALWSFWQDHPWLGSGFGSFWNVGPNGPIYRYATDWVVKIEVGHNGFLDLLAQTGVIGLVLALAAGVVIPTYKLLARSDDNGARGAMLAALLSFSIAHNATESSLFDRDAIPQMFLMFTIAAISLLRDREGTPTYALPEALQPSRSLFGLDNAQARKP